MSVATSEPSARPTPIAKPRKAPVRGGTRSECAACGAVFGGVASFDAHRVGPHAEEFAPGRFRRHPDRRCLTTTELGARFSRDSRGYWTRA